MSTGPKTPEGREAIAQATRQRMASRARIQVLEGFYCWLEVVQGNAFKACQEPREAQAMGSIDGTKITIKG